MTRIESGRTYIQLLCLSRCESASSCFAIIIRYAFDLQFHVAASPYA